MYVCGVYIPLFQGFKEERESIAGAHIVEDHQRSLSPCFPHQRHLVRHGQEGGDEAEEEEDEREEHLQRIRRLERRGNGTARCKHCE